MRRVVVAVLTVLCLAVGGPAVAQAPPPEPVPGTPYDVAARPADGRAHVTWKIPGTVPPGSTGASVIYTVTPYVGQVAQTPRRVGGSCCEGSTIVDGLANGTAYRFTVTAENGAGTSAPSARSAAVRPQPWGPYATPERLARRMHRLFAFRPPTPAEEAAWRQAMEDGTARAADLVLDLVEDGVWDDVVGAVIRYYSFALGGAPDTGGLRYWRDELRSGRRTLSQVARALGATGDFATHNSQPTPEWVRLVYRQATNRWPSASDQAYWEGQLARGVPRWKVALLLSESAENVRRARNETGYYSLKAGFHDEIPRYIWAWQDLWYLGEGTLTLEELTDEHILGAGPDRGPPV